MQFSYTTCLLCIVLYATRFASAFPFYWINPDIFGLTPKPCDAHPTKPYEFCPHRGPFNDSGITFAFKHDDTSAYVDALCPGAAYTVNVTLGPESNELSRRLALLTANSSRISFTEPEATPGCPNRVDLGGSDWEESRSSYLATFQVQCSAAGLPITFKVTSAENQNYIWLQNTRTLRVASGSESVKAGSPCAASVKICGFNPSSYKWRAPGRYVIHWKPPTRRSPPTRVRPSPNRKASKPK